ncbi:MAG: phytanoyl-CoA dioxygenase family protein [Candidatus Microthrix sp.]|nr:phytanoyl-CoA dioxygenase family protein [Candidatus Microthrix sp.]MBK7021404.1 phytanoyl-CoA dioxygenase family protein [Candidatus Microthrix sp.]
MLWGERQHGDGPLSAEQMQRFDTDGIRRDRGRHRRCHGHRLSDRAGRSRGQPAQLASELAITEPDDGLLRSLFDVPGNGPMASLATDDRLATVARQVLGGDYLHQSRGQPQAGRRQDVPGTPTSRPGTSRTACRHVRAVSASVALTENRAWNGPLLLIAGSHRWFLSFRDGRRTTTTARR